MPNVTGHDGTVTLTVQVGASSDTLSATINGMTVVSGVNVSLNPISDVYLGNLFSAQRSFSNLSLAVTAPIEVPEPSAWAMLFGGLGALLVMRRGRRKLCL